MAIALRPTRKRGYVVWGPQPGFQTALLACPITDIFCGGARGPGKTDGILGDWLAHADRYGPAARGILFRRTYPKLEEIEYRVGELLPRLGWRRNVSKRSWTAPNGARLLLRYLDVDADADNYHGHSYSWQGFDELPDWPSPIPVDKLLACLRSPHGVPCVRRSSGNPGGVGHNWVKARYIDPAPPWTPFVGGEDGIERVFIPGTLEDNVILLEADPDYWRRIEASGPEWLVNAWRWGIWDLVAGGMFDDVWKRDVHVLQPFEIPRSWKITRSFDWGSSKPFSVGWWAESDGTEAPNGKHYPRGSLFRIAEWYGWNGTANEGCRLLVPEIAKGILERERELGFSTEPVPTNMPNCWIEGRKVQPGPADSSIYDADRGVSIGGQMEKAGVRWTKADKRPGSRKNGWEKMRTMLKAALQEPPEDPCLYVFGSCLHFIRTVPVLPRDQRNIEDVDTQAEDHIADECRYRVMEPDRTIRVSHFAI